MVINNKFEEPYNKLAPDCPIPLVSKTLIKSRLSKKFEQVIIKEVENKYDNFINYVNQNQVVLKPSEKLLLNSNKSPKSTKTPNISSNKLNEQKSKEW